jgi:hypothetical protein
MGTLELVMQLKKQGVSDQEITRNLQQQGLSPVEIETTLQQASIKGAVSQISGDVPTMQQQYSPQEFDYSGMQPSLLDSMQGQQGAQEEIPQPGQQSSAPQEQYNQGYYQPQTQEYSQDVQGNQQDYAAQGQEYYQAYESQGFDSGTITEIAEQVVQDKTNEFKLQISDLNEFKAILKAQVEHMDLRLQRMEQVIDKLQISILDKVGNYVGGIDTMKKEMEMMQDSFGKVISDKENMNKLRSIAHKHINKSKTERKIVTIIHKKTKTTETPKKKKKI